MKSFLVRKSLVSSQYSTRTHIYFLFHYKMDREWIANRADFDNIEDYIILDRSRIPLNSIGFTRPNRVEIRNILKTLSADGLIQVRHLPNRTIRNMMMSSDSN